MNREPVNPDDPQLTAYALGEMTFSERTEFEAKLESSPTAKAELESMDEIMGLLSRGLKNEWCAEMHEPNLEVLPSVDRSKVIQPAEFNHSRRVITAVAAAVVAICLVGAAVFTQQGEVQMADAGSATPASLMGAVDSLMIAGVENSVHVPQLFLEEEIDDLASLDLVESLDEMTSPVDASYLEANSVIPASHGGIERSQLSGAASSADRVDSYLPPVESGVVRFGIETGLVERRVIAPVAANRSSSRVFVRGYVSMDGVQAREQALSGFQPVSISGNPVIDSEKDLELLHDFQSIQRELGVLAESLPEGSQARSKMEQLYERNRAALSDLKREFVR